MQTVTFHMAAVVFCVLYDFIFGFSSSALSLGIRYAEKENQISTIHTTPNNNQLTLFEFRATPYTHTSSNSNNKQRPTDGSLYYSFAYLSLRKCPIRGPDLCQSERIYRMAQIIPFRFHEFSSHYFPNTHTNTIDLDWSHVKLARLQHKAQASRLR